jgi:hypothetical protein
MTTTSDQVHSLIAELRESSRHAEKMFKSHTTGQLQHRPGEGCWSAAECLAHLNLSNRAYLLPLDTAIRELHGKAFPAKGTFHLNWNARLLKYWLEPPSRLRLPTSAPFRPLPVRDTEVIFREFLALEKELEEKLDSARALALDRVKINSPFAEKMKYNCYSAFVLIAAHNRRHLWQAEQALRS